MKARDLIFIAVAGVAMAGCNSEISRLDAQVRELCQKDGGLHVYEKVILPADKFDKFGEVRVPPKDLMKPEDEFFYEIHSTTYMEGRPRLWRSHQKLFRRSDLKLLGEAIGYTRGGGDFLPPESSFSCPEDADIKYLAHRVFVRAK